MRKYSNWANCMVSKLHDFYKRFAHPKVWTWQNKLSSSLAIHTHWQITVTNGQKPHKIKQAFWLHFHAYIIREVVGSLARNGRTLLKDFWASCNAIYFFCSEDEIVALHPCRKNESSAKLNVFFFFKAHELLFFLSHTDYIQCMDLRYSHFSSGSKYATLIMFNK